ncbi:amidase, partial [Mycobacterium sp. E2462]|uniref:amidase n=1 Tax=Mycobacterium sp. E2462 TaxID=1834133 RepID=UPI000A68BACF
MRLDEYLSLDATALAELVQRREVTAAELLALARQRADAVNPRLNAIVRRLDGVADQRAADPALSGPLAGVPFLVKDLGQQYRGFVTSCGSRSLAHDVADQHALITQRFLAAGLVIFGMTNTPEFGAKGVTESDYLGPARNPWDTARTPGGSSGGSGAAVAAGIVPAAGANDGGGSIRIPAACNGLVGLKVSRGLAPYGPQTGEAMFGMATQGAVSRSVRDSAALCDAMIGPDPAAAYQAALPGEPFSELIRRRPQSLTIGYSTRSAINPHPDREAVAAVAQAAAVLTELGHRVEEVAPPYDDAALGRDFLTIWFAQLHQQI